MDSSIIALNQFKSSLSTKEKFGNDGFQFNGLVQYNVAGKTTIEVLEVILIVGGFEPMIKLDIYEKGIKITKDDFHLDFNSRFNNTEFVFDPVKQSIIITGKNSPKLGNYSVEITESNVNISL